MISQIRLCIDLNLSYLQQGRKATISFLKHYVYEMKPPRKVHAGGVPSDTVDRLAPVPPSFQAPHLALSSEPPTPKGKRE